MKEPTISFDKQKRKFIRLEDRINCIFFRQDKEDKKYAATILDISGGGMRMISKEYVKNGTKLTITLGHPINIDNITAEVVDSRMEGYLSDEKNAAMCTVRIKFGKISMENRKKIIDYIYRCLSEMRDAHKKQARGL
jgi:c-di-GMP-binding flagellar brake protein YcgR